MFSSLLAKILGKSFFEFLKQIWDAFQDNENAKKAKEYDALIKERLISKPIIKQNDDLFNKQQNQNHITNVSKMVQKPSAIIPPKPEIGLTDKITLQKTESDLTKSLKKQVADIATVEASIQAEIDAREANDKAVHEDYAKRHGG